MASPTTFYKKRFTFSLFFQYVLAITLSPCVVVPFLVQSFFFQKSICISIGYASNEQYLQSGSGGRGQTWTDGKQEYSELDKVGLCRHKVTGCSEKNVIL